MWRLPLDMIHIAHHAVSNLCRMKMKEATKARHEEHISCNLSQERSSTSPLSSALRTRCMTEMPDSP